MFRPATYQERRRVLRSRFSSGLLLFPGSDETPLNYSANGYYFRQDSSFLYYWGLDEPGLVALIDIDAGTETLFGTERDLDDEIWMGPCPPLAERAARAGIGNVRPRSELAAVMTAAQKARRHTHFLPQYRAEARLFIEEHLGILASAVGHHASNDLIRAVVAQRSIKTDEEVAEIEKAIAVSREMYQLAMRMTAPGLIEQQIVGAVEGLALARGARTSFPTIFSVRGETLHNHDHSGAMGEGQLALLDSGVESPLHYASDITRAFPVSGRFDARQKAVYEIVVAAQEKAISLIAPGVPYRDIHLAAARVMAEGLIGLGLLRGDPAKIVEAGAHALFFPHGLGHMLGLDVHDMEGLGENFVGYDAEFSRSSQFGLAFLRMGRRLEPGHVVTVEPGLYFIPALIKVWRAEQRHIEFIDYAKAESFIGFGGVRIEDDVAVTRDGRRVLGPPIPKTVAEVEAACTSG